MACDWAWQPEYSALLSIELPKTLVQPLEGGVESRRRKDSTIRFRVRHRFALTAAERDAITAFAVLYGRDLPFTMLSYLDHAPHTHVGLFRVDSERLDFEYDAVDYFHLTVDFSGLGDPWL